jgi:hypothetical protein
MFPEKHRDIVSQLMNGVFITPDQALFKTLHSELSFYQTFFMESFGYQCHGTVDYVYLASEPSKENLSRDVAIFFGLLCLELANQGRNFQEDLMYRHFSESELIDLIQEPIAWKELLRYTTHLKPDSIGNLIQTLIKRNILKRVGKDQYAFTSAHQYFLAFAKDLPLLDEAPVPHRPLPEETRDDESAD